MVLYERISRECIILVIISQSNGIPKLPDCLSADGPCINDRLYRELMNTPFLLVLFLLFNRSSRAKHSVLKSALSRGVQILGKKGRFREQSPDIRQLPLSVICMSHRGKKRGQVEVTMRHPITSTASTHFLS